MYRRSFLMLFPAAVLMRFGIDKAKVRREQIVANYIKTPEGRSKLAQSMLQPIRRKVSHAKIYRSLGV